MKKIKTGFIILSAMIIVYVLLRFYFDINICRCILTAMIVLWIYLNVILLTFSYYWQKRIFIAGLKGQKEILKQIGLMKHNIKFTEYIKFVYKNRFSTKSHKQSSIKGVKEKYKTRVALKEVLIILLFLVIYILIVLNTIENIILLILLLVAGSISLAFLMDFLIILVRYEEGLFISVTEEHKK